MIDGLEHGGCGPPLPHEPMWQCFLSAGRTNAASTSANDGGGILEMSQINQIGMDSAKLHCCHKAAAPKCRRLCVQTFSNDWTETRGDFEMDCYGQIGEIALRQCLDEGIIKCLGLIYIEFYVSFFTVDEPCELGCDGLSFCTNFNNRPTELFRSCTVQADHAAQADVAMWIEKV